MSRNKHRSIEFVPANNKKLRKPFKGYSIVSGRKTVQSVNISDANVNVHEAVQQSIKEFLAVMTRSTDFKAYQDRVSLLGARPEILSPPSTADGSITFSRFLFAHEPRVGAAIETLIETCSVKKLYFTREVTDAFFAPNDSSNDLFVSFLNWFFNDYLFFGKFPFYYIFNAALVDWFVAGEEVFYFNQGLKDRVTLGKNKFTFPTSIVPIAPEYLHFIADMKGFGIPLSNYEIKLPTTVLHMLIDNKFLPSTLNNTELTITADKILYLKRKSALHQTRGKSLVTLVHDPIRIKAQKKLDQLAEERADALRRLLFVKFGEKGKGEEGLRDDDELQALATTIQGQADNGSPTVVVPDDIELAQATGTGPTDFSTRYKEENESIQIGLRIFNAFLTGASGGTGSGNKDLTLAMINARIESSNGEILMQMMPQLIEVLASMNKGILKANKLDTRGIVCKYQNMNFMPAALLSHTMSEWERGLLSNEDYLGTRYRTARTNRTNEVKNQEHLIFGPRQLPHTLSAAPEVVTEENLDDAGNVESTESAEVTNDLGGSLE